jgi:hypothetical protein
MKFNEYMAKQVRIDEMGGIDMTPKQHTILGIIYIPKYNKNVFVGFAVSD